MDSVNITIKARQKAPDGEAENIHHSLQGQYAFKGGRHYLRYLDSHLAAGHEVPTTIKASADELLIMRRGLFRSDQRFVPGGETRADYHTPYGTIELVMHTSSLQVDFGEGAGSVRLRYSLQANGAHVGEYDLEIKAEQA